MADNYQFALTDDDVEQITADAQQFQREYKESGGLGDWPMSTFLPEGNHVARIYPDRGEGGRARLIRTVFMHNSFPINEQGDTVRIWADQRVDRILKEAEDQGLVTIRVGDKDKKIWMWKSRPVGIACCYWIESSDAKTIPVGKTCLAILDNRQMFSFNDFIANQHPEDKRKLIDPNNPAPGIRFSVTKGHKSNTSVGISGMRNYALPMPPMMLRNDKEAEIPFTGLDRLFIEESDRISDEDLTSFENFIRGQIVKARAAGSLAKDTTGKGFKFGNRRGNGEDEQKALPAPQEAGPAPWEGDAAKVPPPGQKSATALPEKSEALPANPVPETGNRHCPLAEKIAAIPSKGVEFEEEKNGKVMFGNRPGKSNPYCSVCDNEDACREATIANRAEKQKAA